MSRAILAIDYDKLLQLAEQCRITRDGSKWIDTQKLINEVNRVSLTVRATAPNNLTEIIANGQKRLTQGERYAPTLAELAAMLGVTRQTLDKWRGGGTIKLQKRERKPGESLCYDLKEIIKGLQIAQKKRAAKD